MITIKRYALLCAPILVLLGSAGCASMPSIEKPQFTHRHYVYSVLLVPEKLGNSPQLELALSLLRMEYPAEQAEALHTVLYGQPDLEVYKDQTFEEQRKGYRSKASELPPDGSGAANFNWRYTEKFNIKQTYQRGIVIERNLENHSVGTNVGNIMKYYNIEIDTNGYRLLSLDDLFSSFQEDQKFRDIVYDELREYSNLISSQSLSQGIYFNNEPELTFNFFITADGLGLHWDPAQIAPPSHGSIQIVLPWYAIRPLMLFTGIELLAKFDIHLIE